MEPQHRFYVLEEPRPGSADDAKTGTNALKEEGFIVGNAPKCPRCGRFIGMLTWLPPFRVEIERWGKEFGDVIQIGSNDLLISGRFRQFYEGNQLTGLIGFDPVEVFRIIRHGRSGGQPPQYFKGNIVRTRTACDQTASGFDWTDSEPVCPECLWKKNSTTLREYKRVVIDPATWTGEDIFYPRGSPVNIVVSSRFRDVCVDNQVSNVIFRPAESHSWQKEPWEP